MEYRIGIQVLSFGKPEYLRKTLDSIYEHKSENDKVCVVEQTEDETLKNLCLDICKNYKSIHIINLQKNLGQRGATNIVYNSGFFNNTKYVMLSDHDNIFHAKLDIYCDILDKYSDCWVSTGYHSPEHDVENKIDSLLLKSTARAGHMVLRTEDFLKLCPMDLEFGVTKPNYNCAWFAGLDWYITHWCSVSPGYKRSEFIYCYSGGVEHIGRESTWQGKYDDEHDLETLNWFRNTSLYDIIKKHPPRHTYVTDKYWYEKLSDSELKEKLGISIIKQNLEILDLFQEKLGIKDLSQSTIENLKSRTIEVKKTKFEKCIICTHYYNKERENLKYKYTRRLFSLELWRRRVRYFFGEDIPIIVFDDNSEDLDKVIEYITEPVEKIYVDDITSIYSNKFTLITFENHLGRNKNGFPGWLRSFKESLKLNTDLLIFTELDLLTNITLDEFINDYFSVWRTDVNLIETSLQIFTRQIKDNLFDILDSIDLNSSIPDPEKIITDILNDYIKETIKNNNLISGMRVDENPFKSIDSITTDKFWIGNPSNKDFEKFYNKFKIDIVNNISTENIIVAFNYIWPEYGIEFLDSSIKSIISKVDEYHIFINSESYIGTPASKSRIDEVISICQKNNFLYNIIIHTDIEDHIEARKGNVIYYFNKIIDIVKGYANYVWLVQSDEIYDPFSVEDILRICSNDEFESCAVVQPICYFDNPHWFVNPPEHFTRPTIVKVSNPDFDNRKEFNIEFHHCSYVLTKSDLNHKFKNWGHRNDVNINRFYDIFNHIKTNKYIKNIHPINPPTYHSVGFVDSFLNRNMFLDWIYYLIFHNDHDEYINSFFNSHKEFYNNYNIYINQYRFFISLIFEMIPDESLIIELGSSLGSNLFLVNTLFPKLNYICFDDDAHSYETSYKLIMKHNLNNARIYHNSCKFLIPKLKNFSVDCSFINLINNPKELSTRFIEIWPKMRDHGIIFGVYDKTNIDIVNKLNTLLVNNVNANCPWGTEKFMFHEIYIDLIEDIEKYKNICLETPLSIWFARVRKS